MYAIVKVGGKQYRVEQGDSLLVDRMPEDEGAKVSLEPLLLAPGGEAAPLFKGDDLGKVSVEATITGHERGPKIHVLKFKPKRGYKKRQGHRSELTRLEIGDIQGAGTKAAATKEARSEAEPAQAKKDQGDKLEQAPKQKRPAPKADPAEPKAEPAEPKKAQGDKLEEVAKTKPTATAKKRPTEERAAKKPAASKGEEESDGS